MPTALLSALLDLVLPRSCIGCASPGEPWCRHCRPDDRPAPVARAALLGDLPTVAAADYGGVVRAALLGYKERGRGELARPLAGLLSRSMARSIEPVRPGRWPVVVGVPARPDAVRARGGDHLARLSRLAAHQLGLRWAGPLRVRRTLRDSAGLSYDERRRNLALAFTAVPPPRFAPKAPVLLVDDIVTTGATLAEASRALRAAGWTVEAGAVIAATERRLAQRSAVPLAPPG